MILDRRRQYVQLYSEGLTAGLTRENMKDTQVLDDIEERFPLEVLLVFRCIARTQVNKAVAQEAREKRQRKLERQKSKGGFWSSMFSSGRKDESDEVCIP